MERTTKLYDEYFRDDQEMMARRNDVFRGLYPHTPQNRIIWEKIRDELNERIRVYDKEMEI